MHKDTTMLPWQDPGLAPAERAAAIGPAAALDWQRRNETEGDSTTGPTLDEWAEHYITTRTRITEGTRHGYRRAYALSYGPLIGSKPITAITRP